MRLGWFHLILLCCVVVGCATQASTSADNDHNGDGSQPVCLPCGATNNKKLLAWQEQLQAVLDLEGLPLTEGTPLAEGLAPINTRGAAYRLVVISPTNESAHKGHIQTQWPDALQQPAALDFQRLLAGERPPHVRLIQTGPNMLLIDARHNSLAFDKPGSWRSWRFVFDTHGTVVLAEVHWGSWVNAQDWQAGRIALVPNPSQEVNE